MNPTDDGVVLLPDSFLRMRHIDPKKVAPSWLAPRHVLLEGVEDIDDISQIAGGRAGKPGTLTVLSRGDGQMPLLMVHDEFTEAAELEDLAYEALERKPIDFAAARDRRGWPSREEFSDLLKEAAADFVKRAKANPSEVRVRHPQDQFCRGYVSVPGMDWKETG